MHNIKTGFRKSGIYPLNPTMLLTTYETPPSTPPPDPTRLSRTPLSTIASENRQFIDQYPRYVDTPVINRFYSLVDHAERSEKVYADFEIARDEVEKLRDQQKSSKRKRKGITVENTGTHILSSQHVLEMSREGEAETAARKQRYNPRLAQVDRLEPVDWDDMLSD
ncbi:hypothetical protein V866_000367 [Kwoniella sp. B9012]